MDRQPSSAVPGPAASPACIRKVDGSCAYARDICAIQDALIAAGSRGRARSGLERVIRDAFKRDLGWDIGARLARVRFCGAVDEMRRHGNPLKVIGHRDRITFHLVASAEREP